VGSQGSVPFNSRKISSRIGFCNLLKRKWLVIKPG
jgi:hypothetical protein